ncbi:unnamed protein product [Clonostachys rosea f. rosea IK726]|uniref:Uncharacterized protein n=1 Tax=Clonostachys rosea f. rosea IK726 TaxID=1349383 RepID=A0ACA9TH49_BIOOC|nr:unnamed protein product [Clonostachys rosea f. rosea IK726]
MASEKGEFPLFRKLPVEIQLKIWTAALENVWVGVCPGTTQFRWNPALAMLTVSKISRERVKKTHHYRLARCGRFPPPNKLWDVVPTNPDTDTFIIPIHDRGHAPLPRNVDLQQSKNHTGDTPEMMQQHMRKLILFETTMNPQRARFAEAVPIGQLLSELSVPPQTASAPAQPEPQDELIPIDPDWSERFPKLNDLTWWIGGEYRVHGPDVVSRPAEGCEWYGEPQDNIKAAWVEDYLGKRENKTKLNSNGSCQSPATQHNEEALKYYEKIGICDDTGTTWAFDEENSFKKNIWHLALKRRKGDDPNSNEPGYLHPARFKSIDMRFSRNVSAVVPKIGLRGYSYNTSSCGGFWAGYRLYLGSRPRLEFSPLVWDDVKEYMNSFQTYEDNKSDRNVLSGLDERYSRSFYNVEGIEPSSPEMIVKISIIRPGEEAPPSHPHHCWEPVAGDFSNCGDLQGVDWRLTVPVSPPPSERDFKKYMAPGFNRRVSDKDKLLLCEREEKLLKILNRFRIRRIFDQVMSEMDSNYPLDFPIPRHFHEGKAPSESTT